MSTWPSRSTTEKSTPIEELLVLRSANGGAARNVPLPSFNHNSVEGHRVELELEVLCLRPRGQGDLSRGRRIADVTPAQCYGLPLGALRRHRQRVRAGRRGGDGDVQLVDDDQGATECFALAPGDLAGDDGPLRVQPSHCADEQCRGDNEDSGCAQRGVPHADPPKKEVARGERTLVLRPSGHSTLTGPA